MVRNKSTCVNPRGGKQDQNQEHMMWEGRFWGGVEDTLWSGDVTTTRMGVGAVGLERSE